MIKVPKVHNPKYYNHIAGQRLVRIEALSDGIFAIAMTLLVLDLKVPINLLIHSEQQLWVALIQLGPNFLSYFLGFLTLGIFWLGHSSQFTFIVKGDRNLNWLSIFFLLFVSLVPFSTALLSQYIAFKLAIGMYWLNILALGISIYLHWHYAYTHKLVSQTYEVRIVDKAIRRRVVIAQILYAASTALCFISTYLSITCIVLVQLNYALAPSFNRSKR